MSQAANDMFSSLRCFDRSTLRTSIVLVTHVDGSQCEERFSNNTSTMECHKVVNPIFPNDSSSSALFRQYGFIPQEKLDLQVGVVRPYLLIAAQDVAEDRSLLCQLGVTHILNLAEPAAVEAFPNVFNYMGLSVRDTMDEDISIHFDDCARFVAQATAQGGRCLVHCNAGRSRSATIVAAVLMKESADSGELMTVKSALSLIQEARPSISPNLHFRSVLQHYEEKLKLDYKLTHSV